MRENNTGGGSAYPESRIQGIEADIAQLEDFAAGLAAEVEGNFGPETVRLTANLRADVPGSSTMPELAAFLRSHHQARSLTFQNMNQFRGGTHRLAEVAQKVSEVYRDSDAFARARVDDVESAFASGPSSTGASRAVPILPSERAVPILPSDSAGNA